MPSPVNNETARGKGGSGFPVEAKIVVGVIVIGVAALVLRAAGIV